MSKQRLWFCSCAKNMGGYACQEILKIFLTTPDEPVIEDIK